MCEGRLFLRFVFSSTDYAGTQLTDFAREDTPRELVGAVCVTFQLPLCSHSMHTIASPLGSHTTRPINIITKVHALSMCGGTLSDEASICL